MADTEIGTNGMSRVVVSVVAIKRVYRNPVFISARNAQKPGGTWPDLHKSGEAPFLLFPIKRFW